VHRTIVLLMLGALHWLNELECQINYSFNKNHGKMVHLWTWSCFIIGYFRNVR